MYKKLFFLVTLALVLGLAGNASGAPMGIWVLDGNAVDTSGNLRHGTLVQGDPCTSIGFIWDAGRGRNVLDCNNPALHTTASIVDLGGGPGDPDPNWAQLKTAITMAGWCKMDTLHETHYMIAKGASYQQGTTPPDALARTYMSGAAGVTSTTQYSTTPLDDGQWHHYATTYDPCGTQLRKIYFDGELESTMTVTGELSDHTETLKIAGRLGTYDHRGWDGQISDIQLHDNALSYLAIRILAENYKAYSPVPVDGAVDQDQQLATVTWSGRAATTNYKVYFGTDETAVDNGDASVDKGEVAGGAAGSYTLPTLAYGETYYWRADANMSGTVHGGFTWDFVVAFGKTTQHSPWDGEKYISTSEQLSWKLGYGALNTEVYISANQQWVIDACDSIRTIVVAPTNTHPPTLAADITYYWRADSNAGALFFVGDVLTFSTDTTSPDAGLVGYWPMDEQFGGSTVTWDISGNAHHGTFKQGSASTTIGIVSDPCRGNVLDVNNVVGSAINSIVQCGGGNTDVDPWAEIQDQITLMAWTKVDSWHETHYMITRGSPYQMTMNNSNGNLRTYWNNLGDQYQYGYVFLDDGEWHHVVATYDSSVPERKVYTDGALQSTETGVSGSLGSVSGGFVIGGRDNPSYDERGFDGFFDDVKLYDVVHPCWKIVAEGTQCGTCVGDLDANSVVNLVDLNTLVGDLTAAKLRPPYEWVITPDDDEWKNCSDMDGDNVITLKDLNRMIGNLTWEKLWFDNWFYSAGKYCP